MMSAPALSPRVWGRKIEGGFFDEKTHTYRTDQGVIVPSTTQVFSILGLQDFSMVNAADLEWKSRFGDAVHASIEYLTGGDLDWDTVDPEIVPAVTGIELRLKELEYEPEAAEEVRIACLGGMHYGMKLDLRGTAMYHGKRRKAIVDLKTGSKFSRTWEWQLGGYDGGTPKQPGDLYLGVIVQVDLEGKVTLHFVDLIRAKREFQILLAAAILKLNAGIATL